MVTTITPEKSEIIGLLCAEGTHFTYTSRYFEFQRKRNTSYFRVKKSERVEFTNTDMNLLQHFRNLMNTVYNYAPKATGTYNPLNLKIRILKKGVINDILNYTDIGCTKWNIPNMILGGNDIVKIAFIRGYFYGDGSFSEKYKVISFTSINENALRQVSTVLKSLGIDNHVYVHSISKPPRRKAFQLRITKIEMIDKFNNVIMHNKGYAEVAKHRKLNMFAMDEVVRR